MTSTTLPRRTPSAQGVDARGILSFLDEVAEAPVVETGIGEWLESDGRLASGGALLEGDLACEVIFVETPHRLRIVCGGDPTAEGTFATWITEPVHPLPLAQMRMPRG